MASLKKRASSQRWLARQRKDPYVKAAKQQGWRSRAAFKLLELDEKYRLFRPGLKVLDVGAAPGGWSQVASKAIGEKGEILAVDLLPIDPLTGVECVQGDILSDEVMDHIRNFSANKRPLELVISDMAPNLTGISTTDQSRAIYLSEMVLSLVNEFLSTEGGLVIKLFQGAGFDDYIRALRSRFKRVVVRKPKSSRADSKEVYAVATGFKRPV